MNPKSNDINVIELTRQLIQVDSSDPGAYESEISDYLYGLLSEIPVSDGRTISIRREEVLPGRSNLMACIPSESDAPPLVFICHMDTVSLGSGWTKDPLGAEQTEGTIYGRGACDMKSGLACALSVFMDYARKYVCGQELSRPLSLIATVDEEADMRGVEAAICSGWVPDQALVLDTEPTNGQIQVAHKGRTWFEIVMQGCTAHASKPQKGADAIAAMAEVISQIRKGILACPAHDDLGISTVTFGQIQGGYAPYVVPDKCTLSVDMRLVPPTDTQTATRIVQAAIAYAGTQISGVDGSFRVTGDRPYIERDDHSLLLAELSSSCKEITGEDAIISFFPGYTDTAVIAGTLHNHNCMSYGPGSLDLAHKPDESVPCSDILRCEQVLTVLVRRLCL